MSEHTPGPWHWRFDGRTCSLEAPTGAVIFTAANADHIVRCVNNHDDLLAALLDGEEALCELSNAYHKDAKRPCPEGTSKSISKMAAAIAKAECDAST